jgi:hypothetical protein
MQLVVVGQDKPQIAFDPSTSVLAHVPAPPVGSVETRMCPEPSAATHRATDGHDTRVTHDPGSTSELAHVGRTDPGSVVTAM